MNTLRLLSNAATTVPAGTAWYLADLGEARGGVWDAGKYKDKDGDIIERYPDGSQQAAHAIECRGRGPAARWRKKG